MEKILDTIFPINIFHITEMKNITEIKNSDEFTLSSEFPEFIQTNHNICPDIYLIFY